MSPAVGDIDGDGTLEIVATVNEQYKETPNTDDPAPFAVSSANGGNQRVYALYPTGPRTETALGSPAAIPIRTRSCRGGLQGSRPPHWSCRRSSATVPTARRSWAT